MSERISQRQPQIVRNLKGHSKNARTGVSKVNVTLTFKIMIYPLDEILGDIPAGSVDFRTLQ